MAPLRLRTQAQKEEKTGDYSGRLITLLDPDCEASEAFRTLRTSLFYKGIDAPQLLLVTSAGPTEGRSTICANLGVVLAQANKDTLIVDCDLRSPDIHKVFGERNSSGMTNILSGERTLPEVWTQPLPNLKVVSAGPILPNLAELLASDRFAEFITQVRQMFDYVLIDSPPVASFSDPVTVATRADGVLLVLDAQSTRSESLRKSVRSLKAVGANILGTVMNNANKTQVGQL